MELAKEERSVREIVETTKKRIYMNERDKKEGKLGCFWRSKRKRVAWLCESFSLFSFCFSFSGFLEVSCLFGEREREGRRKGDILEREDCE